MRTLLPETITFYHSSPIENIDSILKYGLTLMKYDIEGILRAIENSQVTKWKKENARDRALECFKDFQNLICLSGNKEYSIQNGTASKEWQWYLKDTDYHGKVAVFKIDIPIRMLEILTCKSWLNILERFEKLWQEGYFKIKAWKNRVRAKEAKTEQWRKEWMKSVGAIKGYDHWYVNNIPPEYITLLEIAENKPYFWQKESEG